MLHTKSILVLLVLLMLVACAPQATSTPAPTVAVEATPTPEEAPAVAAEQPALRMALLPVLDVLPFFIAQENGYFADEGVSVELVPVSSALEREQLMAAGEVDGTLTDVIGPAITNAAAAPSVKIVAMARRAYDGAPLFRLLVAPGSEVTTPADLAGVTIGIGENTVIHYLGDRMLVQAGLALDDIVYESVPAIPNRFGLMMEGQLGAAILPDPLAQAAIEAGARLILDDTMFVEQQFSQSVLSFRNVSLDEKPDAVRAFLRAWTRAVEALNADPESFRALWLANVSVPDSVKETYVIPPFPVGENTTEAVWEDVSNWLLERGIIEQAASYADSVDNSFLTP